MNHYENKQLPQSLASHIDDPALYSPDEGLIDALNVALELNMPLLLTGEPGTGKTRFAHHIAHHFKLGEVLVFNAKTTSTASDLFYRYQAVKHFQYIQNKLVDDGSPKSAEDFIDYQALGQAIRRADKHISEPAHRSLVLIDEIDKAPRDFPNDILDEIDRMHFFVPELNKRFEAAADLRPLVVLTSNSEKNLPAPFLRRCVYYNIDFPNREKLYQIIQLKLGANIPDLEPLLNEFDSIRTIAAQRSSKQPATAELISWLLILKALQFDASTLESPQVDKKLLLQSYSVLAKSEDLLNALEERINKWQQGR